MAKSSSQNIIDTVGGWFEKAPALPTNVRQTLVNIAPIIALVFGLLGVLGSVAGLGVLSFLSPFAFLSGGMAASNYGTGFIAALIWLVSSILMLVSYPGLKARKIKGWNLLFWSEVVSLIGSLISVSIVSGIIGAVIGFYLLFQIRSYYK